MTRAAAKTAKTAKTAVALEAPAAPARMVATMMAADAAQQAAQAAKKAVATLNNNNSNKNTSTTDGDDQSMQGHEEAFPAAESVAGAAAFPSAGMETECVTRFAHCLRSQMAPADAAVASAAVVSKHDCEVNFDGCLQWGRRKAELEKARVAREAKAVAARAEAAVRKEAAEARLQQKHATSGAEEALARPGSEKASELLAFCAQEFGDDKALQKFCYDKLISKPTTLEAPKYPQQVLREQVVDAPTIQDAMIKAQREGLDTPPQYAELANGELYRVMPLKKALKKHMANKKAPAQVRDAVHPVGKGGVEVDASTLAASVAEAHKMGFKGSPEAVVYHPADGRPVVYKLESPQQSQKLMQMAHGAAGKPKDIEVDSRTLAGSIARAHKMGLKGHPEAIVYHEPNGKTELYEATDRKSVV